MDKPVLTGKWSRRDTLFSICTGVVLVLIWAVMQQDGPLYELRERISSSITTELTTTTKTIRGFAMAQTSEKQRISDDDPAFPGPPFEPAFTELVDSEAGQVYINRSAAVLSLDLISEKEGNNSELAAKLYPTFAKALESDPYILPSLDMIDIYTKHTDDRLLAALEEHIHDGGSTFTGGKQRLLAAWLAEVMAVPQQAGQTEAAAFLAAAVMLGGGEPQAPPAILAAAKRDQARFKDNPFIAKPIGFYTQSETLKRIFMRDRYLQQPFGSELFTGVSGEAGTGAQHYPERPLGAALRIAEALERRPELLAAYTKYLQLAQCITNPNANFNLLDLLQFQQYFGNEAQLIAAIQHSSAWARVHESWNIGSGKLGLCVWPFATSKEDQLFSRIYASSDPSGDTMADLVQAVQDGSLNLAPVPDSGWYDYQVYALETLLLPDHAQEADKLLLSSRYKVRLRRAFEALITQRRETQVKDMASRCPDTASAVALPMLVQRPNLHVEPQPTNYLRTARGYRMLSRGVAGILGAEELGAVQVKGAQDSAAGLLRQAQAMFTALYLTSCNDLGLKPELEPGEVAQLDFTKSKAQLELPESLVIDKLPQLSAKDAAQYAAACAFGNAWSAGLGATEYMQYDPRVIVPVLSSIDGTYADYWAVVGVQLAELEAKYAAVPRAVSAAGLESAEQANARLVDNKDQAQLYWEPGTWYIPVYVFREVRLKPDPPTREEFRAICSKGATADEIVKLLIDKYGLQG